MGSRDKRRQLNNQGFSLVELIVIMIIIVILATAVIVSFVNTADQKVKSSATLISKYMDSTINNCMTKGGNAWIKIRYNSDKKSYYVEDSEGHSEKLAASVAVKYHVENREGEVAIDDANSEVTMTFSRANGAGPQLVINTEPTEGSEEGSSQESEQKILYVDNIKISCNDSLRTLKFYTKTGTYEIKESE